MKVVVDALAATTGGGVTYLRSLLAAALETDPDLEFVLVASRTEQFAELLADGRVEAIYPLGKRPSLPRRVAWELTMLGRTAARLGGDVLFCPSEIAPLRSRIPVVLGLQNPNLYERPVRYASSIQELRLRLLTRIARSSAQRASALVFVSEPFRRQAARVLRASAPQHIVEPGLDAVFAHPPADAGRFAVLRPYVLAVSDFYPYKNFALLVEAFALLDRPDMRLVIAGRSVDRHSYQATLRRTRELGLEDRVTMLGAIALSEMPALYVGSDCLVFPSRLESLGFPPLEAMACGVPVVASDASVMPEILGDAAAYADPESAQSFAAVILSVLSDPLYATALRARGRNRVAPQRHAGAGPALVRAFRGARRGT